MLFVLPVAAQQSHTTWRDYLGGSDSSHYSALKQINRSNVNKLQVAWSYPTGGNFDYSFNPIIIDDVMYVMAKNLSLVALDAASGREIWIHPTRSDSEPPLEGRGGWPVRHRGINYWQNKDGSDRRLLIPVNNYLEEIDARTGKSIQSFGDNGKVDLREGLGRDPKSITQIQSGSPGRVFEDLIILGSTTGEDYMSPPGDIRAYDVRTGKMVWIFHTVPHPGEYGYDTWPKDAWKYIGGTNTWGGFTVDEKRGIAYLPTGSPTYDFYGADRKGDNLFSDCLLALEARTGKRLWHYQLVHHDLWDYDATAAPQLLTVRHNGKMIDVVAQASKQGFLYVFDRVTGQPLWPIEERPVPKSDMPGEAASPTQPFPSKPPPFARQRFTLDDIDPYILSPEKRSKWKDTMQSARNEGIFTPPGLTNTIEMPGNHGGANWGAAATDPTNGTVYVLSVDVPAILKLQPKPSGGKIPPGTAAQQGRTIYERNCQLCHGPERKGNPPAVPSLVDITAKIGEDGVRKIVTQGVGEMPSFPRLTASSLNVLIAYVANRKSGPVNPALEIDRAPAAPYPAGVEAPPVRYWTGYGLDPAAIKPPWSTLTAYDLNEGVIKWQIPAGDAPEVASFGVRDTGVLMIRDGVVVTAGGLIFMATNEEGKLRAYDEETGKQLWVSDLPAGSEGVPAVYEVNGREYLAVCASSSKGPALVESDDTPDQPAPRPSTQKQGDRSYIVFALSTRALIAKSH